MTLLFLLGISPVLASPVEFYGFGARRMGRAGGGVAIADGPESVLSNPASLPGIEHPEVFAGFIYGQSEFRQFPELWWDTNQDGLVNESDDPLDIGPDYEPTFGVMLGVAVPLGPYIAGGLGLYVPPDRLLRLQTFDPQLPTYFLYSNRNQRYELGLALGIRPIWGLSVGGGVQMIPVARYGLTGTLDIALDPASTSETELALDQLVGLEFDVHAMNLDLVPGFAPQLAFHWDAGDASPLLEGLEVGANWRGSAGLPVDVDLDVQLNVRTVSQKQLEALVLPLVLELQLGVYDHYVPSQWNVGVAYTIADTLTISADLRRTAWDKMLVSIAQVASSSIQGAMVDFGENPIKDANPYSLMLRPTYSPRAGVDLKLPPIHTKTGFGDISIRTRGGFGYEPTPLVSQGKDSVLLDSDRIIFGVGLGIEHLNPLWKPDNGTRLVRWDGFLQYHILSNAELVRDDPGTPTAGFSRDGSSIPVGGHLLAAGAQWSVQY